MFRIGRNLAYDLLRRTGKLGPLTPIRLGRRIRFGAAQVAAVLSGEDEA
jgi:hypothetical protein